LDWNLFAWFIAFYALTYVPMFSAGRTSHGGVKAALLMLDFLLTAIAYVCLWCSLPSTWPSLIACVVLAFAAFGASKIMDGYGYDPYGFFERQRARKA